jgi:hypothetical protein
MQKISAYPPPLTPFDTIEATAKETKDRTSELNVAPLLISSFSDL